MAEFKLPDIGEGVHEGEIVKWLVKAGDRVKEDQPMVEVMTDKATVEIPSTVAGVVQALLAKEGDVIKVGQAIAQLETAAGSSAPVVTKPTTPPSAAPSAHVQKQAQAVVSTPPPGPASTAPSNKPEQSHQQDFELGQVLASPSTRRLARDLGISLGQISGSGPVGRVLRSDVLKVSEQGTSASSSLKASGIQVQTSGAKAGTTTVIPLKGVRKKIAESMRHSRDTAAHFTYVDECDVSELVKFRSEMKAYGEKQGIKITYLPFLIKGVVQALKKFPMLNASLDDAQAQIILKNYYNIGIAVDTEDGLVVPVIKDCDQKTILQLAQEIQDKAERAQNRKLTLDELKGGTFTITNAGTIGGLFATPIINHPEVAILGFNKIAKRPVVKGDQIVIADMTWFSISIDHRVVDGATGARFMNEFMSYMGQPKKLLLEMI